jgi:hypothetical protein
MERWERDNINKSVKDSTIDLYRSVQDVSLDIIGDSKYSQLPPIPRAYNT